MPVKNKTRSKRKRNKKTKLKSNTLIAAIAAVLVIAVILSSVIISVSHRRTPQTIYNFNKSVAQGIDVSEHNGEIDWDIVSDSFDFAFIRVGYRGYGNGDICADKYAKKNMKAAQKAGIPFGVYFYTQAVTKEEAEEEADFVFDTIKHYDLSLPVVIDFEYPADKEGINTGRLTEANLSAQENTRIINAFCSRIEKKGYVSGLYASSGILYYNIDMKKLNKNTIIWAADYNDSVTFNIDYTVWQYSKTGQADGIGSKYVDLDYWYN